MTQGPRFSAHVGYLFQDLDWRERLAASARWGFVAVEHPAPFAIDASVLAGWLREEGLEFAQLALPQDPDDPTGKGLAIFPDRRARFQDCVKIGLDYSAAIGCTRVHMMAGIRPVGSSDARLWDAYVEGLAYFADQAAARGITALIENIGHGTIADYFIDTVERARRAIELVGATNIRLLVDVFHAANTGDDGVALVRRHADLLGHLQIADAPGRHEPGTGRLDFPGLLQALDEVGYDGLIGCEYVPATTTEAGLGWLTALRSA